MKKIALFLTACLLAVSLSACAKAPAVPSASDGSAPPSTETSAPEGNASEGMTEIMTKLSENHMLTDDAGLPVPDADYLPLPGFQALEKGSVFNVNWRTAEGDFVAGTAFLAQTDLSGQPLLVTACHYFTSDTSDVNLRDLTSYVQGGDLYDILDENVETVYGTVTKVLPVPDAESYAVNGKAGKDLAAFYVDGAQETKSFSLAKEPCKRGDVIYLAAYINPENTEYYYDDCLYPCVVMSDDGEELQYVLSDEFTTQGASGAPLLNSKGEVVGIHIGSDGSHRYGHSIQSIEAQLKNALAK